MIKNRAELSFSSQGKYLCFLHFYKFYSEKKFLRKKLGAYCFCKGYISYKGALKSVIIFF